MPVVRNAKGEPFSKWKPADKFAYMWQEEHMFHMNGEFYPAREMQFREDRKWRFDFAWPSVMVAVEIDGFGFGHQSQQGMSGDNEKINAATEQGWRVLRYSSRCLGSRQKVSDAVEQVCRVLCEAK